MQWINAGLQIEVRDDGTGFPLDAAGKDVNKETIEEEVQSSFDLVTIRRQLSLYGGRLEIHAQPGAGPRMILIVPAALTG